MKYYTKVGKITVLIILFLFSLVLAFAGNYNNVTNVAISSNTAKINISINGTAFEDLNRDGLRTKEEPSLSGWTITLMLNGKIVSQNTTDNEGRYSFKNLSPGKYTIIENKLAGWNSTHPGGGSYDINLIDKKAVSYNFGNYYGVVKNGLPQHPIISTRDFVAQSLEFEKLIKAETPSGTSNLTKIQRGKRSASFSLLSHVPYIPKERDQGSCGNCWVWSYTAPIEVALDIQNGIHDRLSTQFICSYFNPKQCCAHSAGEFVQFYKTKKMFVPWNNSNANYTDGACMRCPENTKTPFSSISTTNNYPISSISYHPIITRGEGITQDQAINSIKAILNQNKAVVFSFHLDYTTPLVSFFDYGHGTFDPDEYNGLTDTTHPGAHAVVIVGYDDTNPSDRYWIALNSWGAPDAHPDCTFRIKMDINYSNQVKYNYAWYYVYDFAYFDVQFRTQADCLKECENACPACGELPPGMPCGATIHACLQQCSKECEP